MANSAHIVPTKGEWALWKQTHQCSMLKCMQWLTDIGIPIAIIMAFNGMHSMGPKPWLL